MAVLSAQLLMGAGSLWSPPHASGQSVPAAPSSTQAPLTVTSQGFLFHGKPFRIVSGELEYARIPREYWRDRLRKARAMGLNAITVYVFWNLHETEPGHFDFAGQNDVAEFLREAQQEGLLVILRPGPYVCAEWDLGGYPAWLLKDHAMVLRSAQAQYMQAADRWMHRLGQELAPLQASRGGPIIAVQVENEYGSFGKEQDPAYLKSMYALVQASGFDSSFLYTADGGDVMAQGSLPGVFAGVDFGTGDAERSIALLKKFRPDAPVYVAEYWDGWFDHWGDKHQLTDAAKQEAEIRSMLEAGDSISLYMVHGGTSFGWMNGANSSHDDYQPDVSSYDYDAPLDESGRPRPKYFEIRDIIAHATHTTPPPVPDSPPLISLPAIQLQRSLSLWKALPQPVASPAPLSMEDLNQGYGYILYRTDIIGNGPEELAFKDLHSYARVYLDGVLQGVVDRRKGEQSLQLNTPTEHHRLDILVENSGRINFTPALRGERGGLTGPVLLGGRPLQGWQIYPLPFSTLPSSGYAEASCEGPCLYQGEFEVKEPGDTFLNVERLGKGVVWVNGHLLGRFWNIGPAASLYVPGPWLRRGTNQISVFDLNGGSSLTIAGEDHATYIPPRPETTGPEPTSAKQTRPASAGK